MSCESVIFLDVFILIVGIMIKTGKLNDVLMVVFGKTNEEKRKMDMPYFQNAGFIICLIMIILLDLFLLF